MSDAQGKDVKPKISETANVEGQQASSELLSIKIEGPQGSGRDLWVKVRPQTKIVKIIKAWCRSFDVKPEECRFSIDGEIIRLTEGITESNQVIHNEKTVQDHGLENDSGIQVFIEQEGGRQYYIQ